MKPKSIMKEWIKQHMLHKTKRILEVMDNDSRINPVYIDYTKWIKEDLQFILQDLID